MALQKRGSATGKQRAGARNVGVRKRGLAMTTQTSTLTSGRATIAEMPSGARVLQNYVGGNWVSAQAPGLVDVTNPANGQVLARVPLSGRDDIEAAGSAASAALPEWRSRAVGERAQFIFALPEKFLNRTAYLAAPPRQQDGKVLWEALAR